jgi:bifunctional DNA primase/polymerase-like protein
LNTYTETALRMIKTGFTPIPLHGKIPTLPSWQKLCNLTDEQVKAWDKDFENIGMVCGEASGNLVVIDFDGLAAYDLFCQRFPSLVETFTVATGSGNGMHVYFKTDKLPDSTKYMNIYDAPESDPDAWINIEFKANGTQVVVPPSIHPDTHKPYTVAKRVAIRRLPNMEEIVRWAASFKRETVWTPPTIRIGAQDALNPAVLSALQSHFERQGYKMYGDWMATHCPKPHNHRHGDKHPTFGYHVVSGIGNCFSCGTMLTKELCELIGVDYVALGGLFEGSRPLPKTVYHAPEIRLAETGKIPAQVAVDYVSDVQALDQYMAELNGEAVPDTMPLVNPFGFLHKYGGTAELLLPGQLAYFASVSGGTKTTAFETGWTVLQRRGEHSIVYSPEHVDTHGAGMMAARAIQRAGGVTVAEKLSQSLWQLAHANRLQGVTGKPIASLAISASLAKAGQLKKLPGRVFYLKHAGLSAERLCAEIETVYDLEAAKGNIIRALWLDFAQLLWLENNDSGRIWIETALNLVKDTCQRKGLVGFVSSQMNKGQAERAKDNGDFDASMLQWLSEQQCNLLVMFIPKYENGLRVNGKLRGRILKNSYAPPTDEEFDINVDFSRLSWMDKE